MPTRAQIPSLAHCLQPLPSKHHSPSTISNSHSAPLSVPSFQLQQLRHALQTHPPPPLRPPQRRLRRKRPTWRRWRWRWRRLWRSEFRRRRRWRRQVVLLVMVNKKFITLNIYPTFYGYVMFSLCVLHFFSVSPFIFFWVCAKLLLACLVGLKFANLSLTQIRVCLFYCFNPSACVSMHHFVRNNKLLLLLERTFVACSTKKQIHTEFFYKRTFKVHATEVQTCIDFAKATQV